MNRRYRNPGLHDYQKEAYRRLHYGWTKQEFSDHTMNLLDFCHTERVPYILITQPRRFCTLELDLDPAGFQMSLPAHNQLRLWAKQVLERSPAPKKSKSVEFNSTRGRVTGIELEPAKALADHIWRYLADSLPPGYDSGGVA